MKSPVRPSAPCVIRSALYPPPTVRSWRGECVAKLFGLPTTPRAAAADPPSQAVPIPDPGQVMLLTGASGSGKSSLLRAMTAELDRIGRRVIDLARLPLPDLPLVDCLPELPLESALLLLGRMGLGEAWTYLRTPAELSDGQRWRLRVAVALHYLDRQPATEAVLVCDEFAALLDRVTAAVVSRAIRRVIDAHPHLSAVLATSHDDVILPLSPDRVLHCDFGFVQTKPI